MDDSRDSGGGAGIAFFLLKRGKQRDLLANTRANSAG